MGDIKERTSKAGKTTYQARVRKNGTPTQTATFKRKTDAKRWIKNTESAIEEDRFFGARESSKHTVSELIDRYLKDVLPKKSRSMRLAQETQLVWWKGEIGTRIISKVTAPVIVQARDALAMDDVRGTVENEGGEQVSKKRSPASVNRYLAALSHVFTIAVNEWEWADVNPVKRVKRHTEPRGRTRFLEKGELETLLRACQKMDEEDKVGDHLLCPAVLLAVSTGARQMEILRLRWPEVDLDGELIRLTDTKNNESRAVPLKGRALEMVKEMSGLRRIHDDRVFPVPPTRIVNRFQKALKVAKIDDFRWHDLRHTAASHLVMSGASLAEVAEVLGHKTLAMVQRYAHFSAGHTSKVVERMNQAIL